MTRRPQVLFLLALTGVLAMFGVLIAELAGPLALGAYVAVVLGLLVLGARRAQALATPSGRTCSCCTGTVHDPVQVR